MNEAEKEQLIKKDIESIENKVRHAFNQGYEMGMKDREKLNCTDCIIEKSGDFIKSRSEIPNTCGDAISRQATVERLCRVADFMNEKRKGLGSPYVMAALFIQDNKDEFPSVTPLPCGDAISREKLIEALNTWDKFGYAPTNELIPLRGNVDKDKYVPYIHYDDVIKCIKGMSSVTPEPCEDAISRQEVMKHYSTGEIANCHHISRNNLLDFIEQLPPVTPQPTTGRWIDDKCSVCGKGTEDLISSSEWYTNEEPKFCPFCGLKLVASQESEGKG